MPKTVNPELVDRRAERLSAFFERLDAGVSDKEKERRVKMLKRIAASSAKKMGRPKLPKDRVRTRVLTVRLTPDQMKLITCVAKALHQKRSVWIRATLNAAAIVSSRPV